MEAEWTPYDAGWQPLPDELRSTWSPEQAAIYDLYTFRNLARRSPADFAIGIGSPFTKYPYIDLISRSISDLVENRLLLPSGKPADALYVTMPPRHGKSYLISEHTPAWYLTRHPQHRVVLTSYEGDFAASWGRKSRNILAEHGPKFGISVDPEVKANARWELLSPFRGGMDTAGIGGPITGKGGHLLIGDDWVKNSEEANSRAFREAAWDWVVSTFLTRKQVDAETGRRAKFILLMTRWHEDDPAGRLLRELPDSWHTIELPAIAEHDDLLGRAPGEPLNEELVPLDELETQRKLSPYWFSALYQGRPTPDEGGLFSREKFRDWRHPGGVGNEAPGAAYSGTYVLQSTAGEKPVLKSECRHFLTCDLAISLKRHADFTVYSLWAVTPDGDLLLVDRLRDRIEGPEHLPQLQAFVDQATAVGAKPLLVGIENKTHGTQLIKQARRDTALPIRELEPDEDKFTRAIPASTKVGAGKVYLPAHAPWREEFVSECINFPNATHDDQVDTLSYAAHVQDRWFRGKGGRRSRPDPGVTSTTSMEERLDNHIDKRRALLRGRARRAMNRL